MGIRRQILLLFLFLPFQVNSLLALGTHKVLITEFMIYNDTIVADEDGDYSDWIEIFNPGSAAINLLNWSLTDDASNSIKWYFPDTLIQPNQYILIFASGKNRQISGKPLHTSFKLSAGDGFLAIVEPNGLDISYFYDNLPEQYPNISYGYYNTNNNYFDSPTPGYENTVSTFVPPAIFSVTRGFYTQPFTVVLGSSIAGSTIRYTTNGSYPSVAEGILYTAPVSVSTTTPLRAVVYYNSKNSFATTHTYLFLNDVKSQSNSPAGYPSAWGPYTAISGNAIADYEMDSQIVNNSLYKDSIDKAFKSIPTLSVVTSIDNLFSGTSNAETGGIYYFTGAPKSETTVPAPVGTTNVTTYGTGHGWGRLASVEYFDINKTNEFFANCRLELHGGHSRRAEKDPKHSFNLEFKRDYGVSKLKNNLFDEKDAVNEFDALVLRGGFGNSFLHGDYYQRKRGMYIHDAWLKKTQLEMGEKSAHTKFVHLYLNGLYWGLYDISERIDEDFAGAYFKGKEEDFDVVKDYGEATSGSIDAWNAMMVMANNGMSTNTDYYKIQGKNADGIDNPAYPAYVSVDNLIDFMLANIYGGNQDWDHHNWSATLNRIDPGNGFKFFVWDGERIFEGLNDDCITIEDNSNRPSGLFKDLMENSEFKLEVADHVQNHFFNNGVLTPEKVAERWLKYSNEINLAIICETARWGDYRRDVHPFGGSTYELCTKATYWDVEQKRLLEDYFPYRTQIVIDQLKNIGLYPSVSAPVLSWYGKKFITDTTVTISAISGTIYYTTDGSDPRSIGGSVSSSSLTYNGTPIFINDTLTLKTRVKSGTNWSALVKADYILTTPGSYNGNGIIINPQISGVTVYPNPVKDITYFMFDIPQSGLIDISVYSTDGKMVSKVYHGNRPGGQNAISWVPQNLNIGVYIYKIYYAGKVKTGKLMINAN